MFSYPGTISTVQLTALYIKLPAFWFIIIFKFLVRFRVEHLSRFHAVHPAPFRFVPAAERSQSIMHNFILMYIHDCKRGYLRTVLMSVVKSRYKQLSFVKNPELYLDEFLFPEFFYFSRFISSFLLPHKSLMIFVG